jgi:hypothetical protein
VAQELHMDGKTEDKQFAPGYGEFYTADGHDVEALALAVPADASVQRVPKPGSMATAALDAADAAKGGDWGAASASVEDLSNAWASMQVGDVPRLVAPKMTAGIRVLSKALERRDAPRSQQAGIDLAQMSLDLQLRDTPVTNVDLARMDLWARQLILDADAGDAGAVSGDVFALGYVRDRILGSLGEADLTTVNTLLQHLQVAAAEKDLTRATAEAIALHEVFTPLVGG